MNPGVKVRAVGTGPGDAGSQKIYEKLSAQQKAGSAAWDTDVAVVHQRGAATMVNDKLLMPYRNDVAAGKLVSRDTAKNALGANVDGYVLPMFHSQIAFAYNPDLVKSPPKSFAELNEVGEEESEAVRLQRRQGRHVGRGLRDGLGRRRTAAWATSSRRVRIPPPTRARSTSRSRASRTFNQNVVMTPGNAGTLDMLNRGEIAMGPVWVDMFYTWVADGKLSPKIKLSLPSPGLPGQPMYYVIPAKAANAALAKKFIDFAESPEVQADGIVKQFNWYPGIDPQYVQSKLTPAEWNKLFTDISPAELAKNGRPFPLSDYFTDIVEGYERVVLK